ncbi:MAG: YihY/virulence factor BrkB family protein [Bacteroidota bacterium]
MVKTLKYLVTRSIYQILIWLRRIKLPGFQGMGLYDVMRFFFIALMDSKFTLLASAMAYQFFFSLFPSLLLAFLILPEIPVPGIEAKSLHFVLQFFPSSATQGMSEAEFSEMVQGMVSGYFDGGGNFWLIIVSFLLALWGATRGIIAIMKAFTKRVEVFKRRNILELYGTAILIFIALAVIIVGAVLLQNSLLGGLDWLRGEAIMGSRWRLIWGQFFSLFITAATIFLAISMLYFLAPATKERWKFFSPGSIAAGVLMLVALIGLRYYFANFANFDRLYGSLGAIILLMVWFYYLSIMLLIGFELNAAIDLAAYHGGRVKAGPDPEPEKEALPLS